MTAKFRSADVLGVERRRSYSAEEKLRIVEESLAPDGSIKKVCRRYDIAPRLLYTWRSRLRKAGMIRLLRVEAASALTHDASKEVESAAIELAPETSAAVPQVDHAALEPRRGAPTVGPRLGGFVQVAAVREQATAASIAVRIGVDVYVDFPPDYSPERLAAFVKAARV